MIEFQRTVPRSSAGGVKKVAIVGAGFSGAILAINLLRHDGPEAVLIERRHRAGRGIAYSALVDEHLLNVRASNMSAFHDDPGHFVRWLAERGCGLPGEFVSRRTYGDYLSELLQQHARDSAGRLTIVHDEAVAMEFDHGVRITLGSGRRLASDAAVLTLGNLPPHDLAPVAAADLPPSVYVSDPWSASLADSLSNQDDVLIIGTGLTMIDTALLLTARGFGGRIHVMSRRGLLPHAHAQSGVPPLSLNEKPGPLSSALVRQLRDLAGQAGWRSTVDALRPFTQAIWRSATVAQRNRFLRHLRPWWDVHRHRIAPQVAERIATLRAEGRLIPLAGRILRVDGDQRHASVTWRPRGSATEQLLRVRRIVNCTGPQGDLLRTNDPLLRDLLARGLIRPDPHRLGIDVDRQGQVISAGSKPVRGLFALGPMTRGAFWEIVAVPDIRVQSFALARRLADAHWVEGEGL